MHDLMMFEAGRIASQRSWATPEIIALDQIAGLSPSGPPIIAIGEACDVELPVVQALAALAGASRDVVLITEQPITDELMAWLPTNTHHVLGAPLDLDNGSSDPPSTASGREQGTSPPATAGGPFPYCTFLEGDSLAPLRPAQGGWVLEAWKEFVHRHSLSLTDQGRGDQLSAGSWRIGDEGYGAPLWFQPMRRADDHAEFMLIGSTIGVVENPDTQVAVPGSDWQEQFADQVVSWCEQPEAAAMLNRVMGQFGAQTAPLGQRKTADECFTIPTGGGNGPDRVLITDDSDETLVWTSPTDSALISIGAAGRMLVFIYRIPAYRDAAVLDDVLCHAIDSLVRVHELLSNPASTLEGRRDHRLSDQLEQFLRGSGVIAYGALARMQSARNKAQYVGSASGPDGQDLSRMSTIVAEAMEALRDNPDPGWQRLLEYGDLGFPAAVMYQKSGKWPTPQERAAIEDVYQRLCESLALDTQREWATFEEMVNASIAAQQQPPPAHDPVMPHGLGEQICDKCGSLAEAGDQFCGRCGSAL